MATPRFEVVQGFERGPQQPVCSLVRDAAGNLYGTTSWGGAFFGGAIFKTSPDGTVTVLRHLSQETGWGAVRGLTAGPDGNFYGACHGGGANDFGTIYRVTPDGTFTVLHHFAGGAGGEMPSSRLLLASDGNFYGTTFYGGNHGVGTVFKVTPEGVLTILLHMQQDEIGWGPQGELVEAADGSFYGTTRYDIVPGHGEAGSIYRVTPAGVASAVASFADLPDMDLCYPNGLMLASDGNFYGTTLRGGTMGTGTICKLTATGELSVLLDFDDGILGGGFPNDELIEGPDGNLYGTAHQGGELGFGTIFKVSKAGVLTTLANLSIDGGGPCLPLGGLLAGPDGILFGASYGGGASGFGSVYQITTGGQLDILANLSGDPLISPASKLLQASDGSFYGHATHGAAGFFKLAPDLTLSTLALFENQAYNYALVEGSDGNFYGPLVNSGTGVIARVTPEGDIENFYNFDYDIGAPTSVLAGSDGNLYGSTYFGGSSQPAAIFRLALDGTFTELFRSGEEPVFSPNPGMIEASDGNFYGTSSLGGTAENGTIFKLTPDGVFSTLAEFGDPAVNGSFSVAGLTEGSDGNFYGLMSRGGPTEAGAAYKVTPDGILTTIATFDTEYGRLPQGELVEGPDGAFYGAAYEGGTSVNDGTLFRLTKAGELSVVFNFDGIHGRAPLAGLTKAADGNLYGTTSWGGITADGKPAGGGQIFRIRFGAEVETGGATDITDSSAILNATVNPSGYATTVSFQYGTSPDLSSFTTITAGTIPAGSETVNVQALLSGLTPETTYYYRAVAVNDETPLEQTGAIASFQTNESADIVVETGSGRVLSNGAFLSFGLVTVGSPETLTLTIRNASDVTPLTGVAATLSGGGAGHFSVTGVPDASVPASSSTNCAVRFKPTSIGLKTAKLTITSSDPDESPLEVNVYGIALPRILGGLLNGGQ